MKLQPNANPRHTGRGIVLHDGHLLLIERWRDGLHYFSIPGGGIEPGETPEQAAEREIYEETSIRATVGRQLYEMRTADGARHHIFLCNYISGVPALQPDSSEARNTALGMNRFKPVWVPQAQLESTPFIYWEPVGRELRKDIVSGFPNTAKVLAAN